MLDLAQKAVDEALRLGADYADVRVNRLVREELTLRNGQLEGADAPEELGIGVRVLVDGTWGFAAAPGASLALGRDLARRAVRSGSALAGARREPVSLVDRGTTRSGSYATPYEVDPFGVALADKLDLLRRAESSLEGASETVARTAHLSSRREEQWQVSSDGAELYQDLLRTGAGISTVAAAHGKTGRRSYPASFGGNYIAGGFEHALAMELEQHGARMRDESVALCSAEPCPGGKRDVILMGNQLMLQIHESVGHPNELDRVFGHEVDLAGGSFATTEKAGRFRYGSEIVNLVADSTVAGGLDTRGWDDDGVASKRFHVVKDGVFQGHHTSREWAGTVGAQQSNATNRAEGWYNPPIIRITNLSLMPGSWGLEELIADTEDGILCDTVKMWSIDQQRLNFQFTTEIGWEIKNGRRTRIVSNPTYQGTTPTFWRSCDAICNEDHWQLWGVTNCGKGNPMQVAEMSHGAAPARFRDVSFVG